MLIRKATEADADSACQVIRDSIAVLCELDHEGDPDHIARWLSNKNPENVRRWIRTTHVFVAEDHGHIVGVAAMATDGKVTLNYIAPSHRLQGISKALMYHLEETALTLQIEALTLESTRTALPFYEGLGFVRVPADYVLPLTGTPAAVLRKIVKKHHSIEMGPGTSDRRSLH